MLFWIGAGAAILAGLWLFFLNYNPVIRTYTLPYSSLPEEFDSFTLAVLSDLHDSTYGKNNRRLLRKIGKADPDIVCLAGDMHQNRDSREYLAFLTELCRNYPVFFAEGNHDLSPLHMGISYPDYCSALRRTGVRLLKGNFYDIRRGKASLRLCGTGFRHFSPSRVLCGEGFSVAVLHDPEAFDTLRSKPSLTLSGHIHGGAVRLPFIGGIFAPGLGKSLPERIRSGCFFPKYSKGIYGEGEHRLAVSVGLGKACCQPFRLIRPEIMVIRLKRK